MRVTLRHMSDYEVPAPTTTDRLGRDNRIDADLASMRVRYVPEPLREAHLPHDPLVTVADWLADAVAAGLPEPNAMVLSTVDPDGLPSSRHVLLKEIDRGAGAFVFYTNLGSRKAHAIAAHPEVALCFPWFAVSRQVTVVGRAEQVDRATAATYWAQRPRESQLGAWASAQSAVIESREALHAQLAAVRERFAGSGPIPLPDFWGGFRVVPDRVELWQGQPGRMHDRLLYRRADAGWTLARLQP